MEYIHLKDIDFAANVKSRVFGIFMARDVVVRKQKDGVTDFISLTMCDRDFSIEAKRFGATAEEIELMKNGGVYRAAINIEEYSKSPTGYSCIIYNFELHDEPAGNFIDWSEGMDEARNTIQRALNMVGESIYRGLVFNLIMPNWDKFAVWTAASSFHHNSLGGLMVHTAEVIEQSEQIADLWDEKYGPGFINKPLLISAALLHDLAKTKELKVDTFSGSTEYSTQAALETHITMCVSMIDIEAYKIGFGYQICNGSDDSSELKTEEQIKSEQEALSLLKHCILSHHGVKEYGSPLPPNCPEAAILHAADNISAEMFRFNKSLKNMEPGTSQTVWQGGSMITTYKESTK